MIRALTRMSGRRELVGQIFVAVSLCIIAISACGPYMPPIPTATSTPTSPPKPKFEPDWVDSNNGSTKGCSLTSAGDLQIVTASPFTQFEAYCFPPPLVVRTINTATTPITFTVTLQVVSKSAGADDFRYGIIFRDIGSDRYFFNMHSDGHWYVSEVDTGKVWADNTVANFDAARPHAFGVTFLDPSHYQLLIDAQTVGAFSATKLTMGSTGVSVIDTLPTSTVLATSYSLT